MSSCGSGSTLVRSGAFQIYMVDEVSCEIIPGLLLLLSLAENRRFRLHVCVKSDYIGLDDNGIYMSMSGLSGEIKFVGGFAESDRFPFWSQASFISLWKLDDAPRHPGLATGCSFFGRVFLQMHEGALLGTTYGVFYYETATGLRVHVGNTAWHETKYSETI